MVDIGLTRKDRRYPPKHLTRGVELFSGGSIWTTLGRTKEQIDSGEIYHDEMDGYNVSHITNGRKVVLASCTTKLSIKMQMEYLYGSSVE